MTAREMGRSLAAMLLSLWAGGAGADHDSGADWAWHVISGGSDESRLAVYRREGLFGIYDISCDLTGATAEPAGDSGATIDFAYPESNPGGLLVITCDVGAHSQKLLILDLASRSSRPVLVRSGSYFVGWELQEGELWISFDQPCDSGPTAECPDGYETLFERFPPLPESPAQ